MKMLKVFAFMMVLCFVATSAWSSHVKLAPNGKGDVVIYPFFMGAASLETKLTVVNSDQSSSSVAKLVVRSHKYSKELLDFFIYLSPGDVWNGTLKWDAEKDDIVMYSEDDSAQAVAGEFASADTPMNVALFDEELKQDNADSYGDSKLFGYVYALNAATSSGDVEDIPEVGDETVEIDGEEYNVNDPETPKAAVKKWFESLDDSDIEGTDRNKLAGWMDFNAAGVLTSRLKATTLYNNSLTEKPQLQKDTVLGEASTETDLFNIEAVLAKTNIVMPYQNTDSDYSLHFFTFPTKYSRITEKTNSDRLEVVSGGGTIRGFASETYPESPFFSTEDNISRTSVDFSDLDELCAIYKPAVYNMEEEKAEDPERIFSPFRTDTGVLCSEVNFLPSDTFEFTEGVAHYAFDDTLTANQENPNISYAGAPTIPFVMELGSSGLSLSYAAWDEGEYSNINTGEYINIYPTEGEQF